MPATIAPETTPGTPPHWYRPMNLARWAVAVAGIVVAFVVSPSVRAAVEAGGTDPAAFWRLMPIALYAVLAISGLNILASTLIALAAALALDLPTLPEAGQLLIGSFTSEVRQQHRSCSPRMRLKRLTWHHARVPREPAAS